MSMIPRKEVRSVKPVKRFSLATTSSLPTDVKIIKECIRVDSILAEKKSNMNLEVRKSSYDFYLRES